MFISSYGLILNKLLLRFDKSSNNLILGLRRPYYIKRKKALLSYISSPVHGYLEGKKTVRFSNDGIAISWAIVLTDLGYEVDIISWDDLNFRVNKDYELFVCHGGVNFDYIYSQFKKIPKIIYFATGNYWKFHNNQEVKRINSFNKKYNANFKPDRFIEYSEEKANRLADAIIVLGNKSSKKMFPNKKIYNINNASYEDKHFNTIIKNKDFEKTRDNFMFFAGAGNVHKGLDILLEAFKGLDINLYVVGHIDDEFYKIMKPFFNEANIHKVGEVSMRSREFYKISDKCAFVILPSCSEGQAGSVVECMNQGLIPIVTEETRLDTEGFGVTLKNASVREIKCISKKMANLSPDKIKKMTLEVRKDVLKNHSQKYFFNKIKENLYNIINE
jgi:glycosyltransferase involved in cell wall biosynthesis